MLFCFETMLDETKYSQFDNPKEAMYQAVHHEFVASALAVKN